MDNKYSEAFADFIAEKYKDLHHDNSQKYQIGERVSYISLRFLSNSVLRNFIGCEFIVSAVNAIYDEESGKTFVEYLLEGFPYFVWEHEIQSCAGKIRQDCCHDN